MFICMHVVKIDSLYPSRTVVLEKVNTISIETHFHRNRRCWVGYFICYDDIRIPPKLLYNELLYNTQPQYKPRKCFRGSLKESLAAYHMDELENPSAS